MELHKLFRNNKDLGELGEDLAAKSLKKKKISIISRNYRQNNGEIDIIAEDGDDLVFIEVKTRSNTKYGTPGEAVNFSKQQQIIRVAREYISRHNLFHKNIRFDVITVLLMKNETPEIELIKNAFEL